TIGEIDDLGLARSVLDQRLAFGENCGHQRVMGRTDGYLGQLDAVADESPRRTGNDVTSGEVDLGAELLHRLDMQIDRTCADGAATWQRHLGPAATCNEGCEHPEARAHARHHLIGSGGIDDLCGAESEGLSVARALARPLAGDSHIDAVIAENAG